MHEKKFMGKIETEENVVAEGLPPQAITGDQDISRFLLYQLRLSMLKAKGIDMVVSFLMESGVRILLDDLKEAIDRGVQVRILTGNYLGITQPSALYLIKHALHDAVDLRFYSDQTRSFHAKSYIFHYEKTSDIYIGSSNISKSALTSGIEWNYRFNSGMDPDNFHLFYSTFEELFHEHAIRITDEELRRYAKGWHRPAVAGDLEKYESIDNQRENIRKRIEPRGAQIEALCALEDCRKEGARKALVQAATGVGKTYLAAFDSKSYGRVLFVAHREEILKQAAQSFHQVRPEDSYGFFTGNAKCTDRQLIFASVASLGKEACLSPSYFAPDAFDYLVIDAYEIIGLNQKSLINQGLDWLRPIFLTQKEAMKMSIRRFYEQRRKSAA